MPFVSRDGNGNITGYFENKQAGFAEEFTAEAPPIPIIPDANSFVQSVKSAVGGIVSANSLAVAYPLFFTAVQSQQWADVQALVVDAKAKSVITTTQYDVIKSAAVTANIPGAINW